jgi:hypothetical protein
MALKQVSNAAETPLKSHDGHFRICPAMPVKPFAIDRCRGCFGADHAGNPDGNLDRTVQSAPRHLADGH